MDNLQEKANKFGTKYLITDTGEIVSKECSTCDTMKSVVEYNALKNGLGGIASSCKVCRRISDMERNDRRNRKMAKGKPTNKPSYKRVLKEKTATEKELINRTARKAATGTPTASTVEKTTEARRRARLLYETDKKLAEAEYIKTGKKKKEINFIDRIILENYYSRTGN